MYEVCFNQTSKCIALLDKISEFLPLVISFRILTIRNEYFDILFTISFERTYVRIIEELAQFPVTARGGGSAKRAFERVTAFIRLAQGVVGNI